MEISSKTIANILDGILKGDPEKKITGVAPFELAKDSDITLAAAPKFLKNIAGTKAGVIIVPKDFKGREDLNTIGVENPPVAFAKAIEIFNPPSPVERSISPSAITGKNFKCGHIVSIAHMVSIGNNVTMGERVRIRPGVVIENDVTMGDDVEIFPNVTIRAKTKIGSRVIINSGTVIGSDGFGFAPEGIKYYKIPHTGIVQIDDDVEIGALNAIDRATFGKTWIQKGVKTDNLVHIAHNVTIGENSIVVAQVGISGSTKVGRHVILAGQAGISGHLKIGDNVTVGPQAGVGKSIPDGEVVSGSPEIPHRLWLRVQRTIPQLPDLKKRIMKLEKLLGKAEKSE